MYNKKENNESRPAKENTAAEYLFWGEDLAFTSGQWLLLAAYAEVAPQPEPQFNPLVCFPN